MITNCDRWSHLNLCKLTGYLTGNYAHLSSESMLVIPTCTLAWAENNRRGLMQVNLHMLYSD